MVKPLRLLESLAGRETLVLLQRGCRRPCMRSSCAERLTALLEMLSSDPPGDAAAATALAVAAGFARAAAEEAAEKECWDSFADLAEAAERLERAAARLGGAPPGPLGARSGPPSRPA